MNVQKSFAEILNPYRFLIEQKLRESVVLLGPKNEVRDACEYALLAGGKRFRPALVLMIAKALGFGVDVFPAAIGIEYFHTASLIADDLPCMDNDDERRNAPTVHRKFSESIALLSTYALISAGYACLAQNSRLLKSSKHPFASESDHLCVLALENVSFNTGLDGATGGQLMDILPSHLSLDFMKEVIHKKTGSLFEISFVLGWLFGGGDPSKIDLVKKAAAHFGLAFQIADDVEDREQDKVNKRSINMANVFGLEPAKKMFHEEMERFYQILIELKLNRGDLHDLGRLLVQSLEKKQAT